MDSESTSSPASLGPKVSGPADPPAPSPDPASPHHGLAAGLPTPPSAPPPAAPARGSTTPPDAQEGSDAATSPETSTHASEGSPASPSQPPHGSGGALSHLPVPPVQAAPQAPPNHPKPVPARKSSTSQLVWTSGDFRPHPRNTQPYNGIRITVTPKYDSKGQLFSLHLVFEDFTYTAHGVTFEHTFQPLESGAELPLQPSGKFTLTGTIKLELSTVEPDCVILMLDKGAFGEHNHQQQVMGGLLKIPCRGKPPGQSADKKPDGKKSGDRTSNDSEHETSSAGSSKAHGGPSSGPTNAPPPTPPSKPPADAASDPSKPPPAAPHSPASPSGSPSSGSLQVQADGADGFRVSGQLRLLVKGRPMNVRITAHGQPAGEATDARRHHGLQPPISPPRGDGEAS